MITGALAFVISFVAAATSVTVPLIQPEDRLWTGAFNVGLSYNLSLLIGTAVDYVAINRGLYDASNFSKDLDEPGGLSGFTAQADGCQEMYMTYNASMDLMSTHGLISSDQTLAYLVKPSSSEATLTGPENRVPDDGIVGFTYDVRSPLMSNVSGHHKRLPFFQKLCNQSRVTECRFGLALGTAGKGSLTMGRNADELYRDELGAVTLPLMGQYDQKWQWQFQGNVHDQRAAVHAKSLDGVRQLGGKCAF